MKKTKIAAILLSLWLALFSAVVTSRAGDINGDTLGMSYAVTSVNYYVSNNVVVPGYPSGFGIDASASFFFTNGMIIVHANPANWTAGGFNGFIVTDLTKDAGFTSFTIGSFTGGVQPALSFSENSLTVNFTPGGLSNGDIDVDYTFLFTSTAGAGSGPGSGPGGPSLSISGPVSGGGVVLTWPSSTNSFSLQCTTNLIVPNWQTLTNRPVLSGNRLQIQVPITNGNAQAYYRLVSE